MRLLRIINFILFTFFLFFIGGYNMKINIKKEFYDFKHNKALLCNTDCKCNLEMVKFKGNPVRFISFDIYL